MMKTMAAQASQRKTSAQPFIDIVRLDASQISAMIELQDMHFAECAASPFNAQPIIRRDREWLKDHFDLGGGGHAAYTNNHRLVGCALHGIGAEIIPASLINAFGKAAAAERTSLVGSVLVDPQYRGLHIADRLLEACEATACIEERMSVWSRVAQDNPRGQSMFQNRRFTVMGTDTSPDRPGDAPPVFVLAKLLPEL